jgi:hypothetical protein
MGALPFPGSLQKSRRHTTHFKSSFSFCLISKDPGDAGHSCDANSTFVFAFGVFALPASDVVLSVFREGVAFGRDPDLVVLASPPWCAVFPLVERISLCATFATSFRRSTSAAIEPRHSAFRETAIGVFPSAFRTARFAPASRRTLTHSVSPFSHARCNGVLPSVLGRETSICVVALSPRV